MWPWQKEGVPQIQKRQILIFDSKIIIVGGEAGMMNPQSRSCTIIMCMTRSEDKKQYLVVLIFRNPGFPHFFSNLRGGKTFLVFHKIVYILYISDQIYILLFR